MLRLSKKVEYALIALMDLAQKDNIEPVTAKYLAGTYNIPQELLGKVLQTLTRNEILISVQGVKGGYILGKSPDKISLSIIIESLEGPISMTSCNHSETERCGCDLLTTCTIKSPMEVIQNELSKYFKNISLKDLKTNYNNQVSQPVQITV